MMDTLYPANYPSNGIAPQVHSDLKHGQAASVDSRLLLDFQFLPTVNFRPERGYYFFSHYRYKRFDNYFTRTGDLMNEFRQYENELIKAEAYVNLNQLTNALAILNDPNNPRISRGKLSALGVETTKQKILDAIFYERDIELMTQGFMLGFCDMRRRDLLQYGTPLHFPLPSSLKLNYYTFGGVNFADGNNTSNGGWLNNNGDFINIEESHNNEFNVFPNPANIYIQLNNVTQNSFVSVYNCNGSIVLQKQLNNNNKMDISFLQKGFYLIRITFNNNVRFGKFCKE
jgi:hypothetical protein